MPTAATGGAAATIRGPTWVGFGERRAIERGQILVVFVLAMVAIIGIVGLAIDGGGAYAQRRDQQTAADLAALAGANDYLLSNNATQAIDAGPDDRGGERLHERVGSTSVDVAIDTTQRRRGRRSRSSRRTGTRSSARSG